MVLCVIYLYRDGRHIVYITQNLNTHYHDLKQLHVPVYVCYTCTTTLYMYQYMYIIHVPVYVHYTCTIYVKTLTINKILIELYIIHGSMLVILWDTSHRVPLLHTYIFSYTVLAECSPFSHPSLQPFACNQWTMEMYISMQ